MSLTELISIYRTAISIPNANAVNVTVFSPPRIKRRILQFSDTVKSANQQTYVQIFQTTFSFTIDAENRPIARRPFFFSTLQLLFTAAAL